MQGTHVFDCDGVLLTTNKAKSEAFYQAALPYGEEPARQIVAFHQRAGSLSRKARWEHFFKRILKREPEEGELERVLANCTEHVLAGAREATVVPGAQEFIESCEHPLVVSGVTTAEVAELLAHHGLTGFEGIYGGPKRKRDILRQLVKNDTITLPATYYGDTEDDYQAALAAGLEFVFVSGYSEWADWRQYFAQRPEIRIIEDFRELVRTASKEAVKARVGPDGFGYVDGKRVGYVGRAMAGATVTMR